MFRFWLNLSSPFLVRVNIDFNRKFERMHSCKSYSPFPRAATPLPSTLVHNDDDTIIKAIKNIEEILL